MYHLCHSFADWEGVRNLVSAVPSSVKRIILVSSVGVTKFNEIPWRYAFHVVMYQCLVRACHSEVKMVVLQLGERGMLS